MVFVVFFRFSENINLVVLNRIPNIDQHHIFMLFTNVVHISGNLCIRTGFVSDIRTITPRHNTTVYIRGSKNFDIDFLCHRSA